MCGIAGVVNLDGRPADPALLARLRDVIAHRGPDDAGVHVDGSVGLAHRRLSILDLSPAGHQPMANADGTSWIVFNGEIFNYVELAAGLRAQGETFRSGSDTEVLLRLVERRGAAALDDLVGMFAFAVWDSRRRTLFAARDRAGIKPFYYALTPTAFVFGSEVKAVLAHPAVVRALDHEGLADQLFTGYPQADRTLFRGVRQLPPGCCLELHDGRLEVRPYWSVHYKYAPARSEATVLEELGTLLDDAVRLHCRSDAPLGAHLSGGVDSSTVAALAARVRPGLPTFSIRFAEGGIFDESVHARAVAAAIGSRHYEDTPQPAELDALLATLIWHMDMPMVSSGGFAYFAGARLARRHVTVALTGHGGDEVFGGYPAQFQVAYGHTGAFDLAARARQLDEPPMRRLAALLRREGVGGLWQRVRGRVRPAAPLSPEALWIRLHCGTPLHERPQLHRGFLRALGGYDPRADYLRHFTDAPTDQLFDRALHHDLRCYLPGLLHMEDRVSMAMALESRVPLLDHRIIEYLATVPPAQKVRPDESKRLLRSIMAGVLPESVRTRRDKGAFMAPVAQWFDGALATLGDDILRAPACLDRGLFDPDYIRRLRPGGSEVWSMVNLELWCRIFLDEDPAWLARVEPLSARLALA